jgi:uncharacterized protein YneF (UPF0154 family)
MSSYLLLRNNKESGPFTMDEIKGMSLKAYDLLWVVGKSAAWRYPGEIPEFKSFAPAVPEQATDFFRKKPNTDTPTADPGVSKKPDSVNSWPKETNSFRSNTSHSVYVNLPAEKKIFTVPPARILQDTVFISSGIGEPENDFSDIYKKKPSVIARYSGNILWISTIVLLFGAGILTGFFISDRRKFFSTDANHPQNNPSLRPVVLMDKKEKLPVRTEFQSEIKARDIIDINADSVKKINSVPKKLTGKTAKKNLKNNIAGKDSVAAETTIISSLKINDSLKQNTISKTEALYQKIKAHPENYINLVTGRYSTGLFGGISAFPVTISNNSTVRLDLVIVAVDYVQNNEKVYKTENLSFNDLEPGETVTIKAPKSSRGTKISTRIHVVNTRQPDLSSSN